jgi:thiol-disulfide isomerase/thioredoxin
MKKILSSFGLFVVLAVVFSSLTGCGGSNGASNGTTSNAGNPANGTSNTAKKSDYPPLATAVAQADMKNLDGSLTKVADMKGKVLLLNMWATWCGPCRGEMPSLVRMQDEHRDKGFEIIGLNTDDGDTKQMVEEFAKEMKLNYTLVWADTAMQNGLLKISKFNGIPQSFIVDRDGNLRGVFRGGGKSEVKKMEELVAKIVNGDETAYVQSDDEKADRPAVADTESAAKEAEKKNLESKTKE